MKEGIECGRERERRNGGRGKESRREVRERGVIIVQISGFHLQTPQLRVVVEEGGREGVTSDRWN